VDRRPEPVRARRVHGFHQSPTAGCDGPPGSEPGSGGISRCLRAPSGRGCPASRRLPPNRFVCARHLRPLGNSVGWRRISRCPAEVCWPERMALQTLTPGERNGTEAGSLPHRSARRRRRQKVYLRYCKVFRHRSGGLGLGTKPNKSRSGWRFGNRRCPSDQPGVSEYFTVLRMHHWASAVCGRLTN
jgi:hypothetical protein